MTSGVVLLIIVPLAASALCLVEKSIPRLRVSAAVALGSTITLVGIVVALLPALLEHDELVYRIGGFGAPAGIELRLDGIGWIGAAISAAISLAGVLFAIAERGRSASFFALYLVLVAGVVGVVITDDLFTMFVLFELVGVAAYGLIAYSGKPGAMYAALKYLILSSVAMAIYLVALYAVYRQTGTLSIQSLASSSSSIVAKPLILGSFIVGIATRAAVFPFHAWLPDAHANAPHAVSAVLSGAMVKASFFALWRVFDLLDTGAFADVLVWIGAFSAAGAVVQALAQRDVKKLLAWHTVSQMGYIVSAFAVAGAAGRSAAVHYIGAHAVFKALLFLVVGVTLAHGSERDVYKAGGFLRRSPTLFLVFLVGALSISGIPPFNGYVAKKLVLTALLNGGPKGAYGLLWITAIGTSASFLKLSAIFWRRNSRTESANVEPIRRGYFVPLVPLAAVCIGVGVIPGVTQRFIGTMLDSDPALYRVYSLASVGSALLPAGLGVGLYALIRTRTGAAILGRIRRMNATLDGATLLLMIGFVVLGGLAVL